MKNTHAILIAILSMGLGLALPAVDLYYEGRLVDAAGQARANATVRVTPALYGAATGGEALATFADIAIKTDATGAFGTYVKGATLPEAAALWLSLTPQGQAEALPRMKICAAPLAVHAASAEAITNVGAVSTGALTVKTLSATAITASEHADLNGTLTFTGTTLDNFTAFSLDRITASGALRMMRPAGITGMTQDYGAFSADDSLYAEKNDWADKNLVAEADGFIVAVAKSDDSHGSPSYYLTMKVGNIAYADGRDLNTDDAANGIVLTAPVRKGENVYLKTRCSKSGAYWRKGYLKWRFIYFGAK